MKRHSDQRGFTLVELMITLLIAAILMAIAVPGFNSISQRSRQINIIGDLSGMIARARSEAAARAQPVSICVSADSVDCEDAGVAWEHGWISFLDNGAGGGTAGNRVRDGDEEVLQVAPAISQGSLRTSGFTSAGAVGFSANGTMESTGTFRHCGTGGLPTLKAIVLNLAGQVRMAVDSNSDGSLEDSSGVAIASCT